MKDKCFSIIIPCYNVAKYVERCVETLQRQSYHNMEIILIDDGSTDDTFALCQKLQQEYNNVLSITHCYDGQEATRNRGQEATRNRGLEATRNRGLEAANGEWVCFLDADDTFENDALERAQETFEQYPDIDFLLTGLTYVYEDRGQERKDIADLPKRIYTAGEIAKNALNKIPWPVMSCVGTKIYKRAFIEKNALRFDINYKFNEDGAFAIQAFWKAEKIAHLPEPMYRYLQRPGSIMHSYRPNAFISLNRVNNLLRDYFKSFGVLEEKNTYIILRKWALTQEILIAEASYKDYKSFSSLFKKLRDDEDAAVICENLSFVSDLSTRSKIMLFLFRKRMYFFMHICIKMRTMLRTRRMHKR